MSQLMIGQCYFYFSALICITDVDAEFVHYVHADTAGQPDFDRPGRACIVRFLDNSTIYHVPGVSLWHKFLARVHELREAMGFCVHHYEDELEKQDEIKGFISGGEILQRCVRCNKVNHVKY